MKRNTLFLLTLMFVFLLQGAYAQTLRITPSATTAAACPLTSITYNVGVSSGTLPTCTYRWTVTGGKFDGVNTGKSVKVIWHDETGLGTLTVEGSSCRDQSGISATGSYTRLSVFGQNFPSTGSCASSASVPICSTAPFNICVNRMFINNTGGVNQPPLKEVDAYIWFIPAGFKQSSSTNVGPVSVTTTTNVLTLEPMGPGAGTVSVRGTVKNSCGQSVSDSNPTSIDIIRTPSLSITTAHGAYTARCGAVAPITFSVTALPCAVSYAWNSIPSGWAGSSSTGAIELTPNGQNGGTLSVVIGLSTGHSVTVTQAIGYSDAAPSALLMNNNNGNTEICYGESFTYSAVVPLGYTSNFGFDWYADSGILINGASSSLATPVHTTTNSVTITTAGQAYGSKVLRVRLNNLSCTPGVYGWKETRVGVYSNEEFSIVGPSAVCPNSVADYSSSYIGGDVADYQWSAPNGWSSSGQGTPYFSVSVPYNFIGDNAAITLRLANRCGYTNTPYVKTLSLGSCGFSVSPNPASSTLTVSDLNLNEGETAEAQLMNKNGKEVQTGRSNNGKIDIDVSTLPNGPYVLIVEYKGKTESKNIVVSH